jgi:hypothetical protein
MANQLSMPTDPRFKDLTGARFGRLVVTGFAGREAGPGRTTNFLWFCVCDCGARSTPSGRNLKSGNTQSCGCIARERAAALNLTHGHAKGYRPTPELKTWQMIKARCHTPTASGYHKYGARGIKVCDRWREDFSAFLTDMGPRPSPLHSIDRLDNSKGYSPDNCRWATASEQAYNRRTAHFLTINGERMHLEDAAKLSPVGVSAVLRRLQKGWSDEAAVFTPPLATGGVLGGGRIRQRKRGLTPGPEGT